MHCHEAAFAGATCRIEIDRQPDHPGPAFAAHMWLVTDDGRNSPLVLADKGPAEIRGETEAAALNAALAYLATRFGALSEYPHRCADVPGPGDAGPPVAAEP